MINLAAAPSIAFCVALVLVWCLTRGWLAQIAVDCPNERSLHNSPIPRSGGLGLHAGILLALLISGLDIPAIIVFPLLALLAVSALDDVLGLSVIARLATHLLAGCTVSAYLILPEYGPVGFVVSIFGIVWMINLYNFMDGSDGLAGGMAMFGFTFYGIAAYLEGSLAFALLNFSIASASAAFLVFNFHPARIFLGDAGSVPLGFLAASLGLIGWLHQAWIWWFPFLVFSPFIIDASVTLIRRAYSRATLWHAHRDHYYQRLVQLGWGHRRTAIAEYILMWFCGGAALAGMRWTQDQQVTLLITMATVYLAILLSIEVAWRKFQKEKSL